MTIHEWFDLTYSSYLVLPRSVLQSTPFEWQERFVHMLQELQGMDFGPVPREGSYRVTLHLGNHFIHDIFRDYDRGRREIERST